MNLSLRNHRFRLYAIVLLTLYFLSQIFVFGFASHILHAYITTALNGIVAIEIFFFLRNINPVVATRWFWIFFMLRIFLMLMIFIISLIVMPKEKMQSFVLFFMTSYFAWIAIEVWVIQKIGD